MYTMRRIRDDGDQTLWMLQLKGIPGDVLLETALRKVAPEASFEVRGRNEALHTATLALPKSLSDRDREMFLRHVGVYALQELNEQDHSRP